MDNRDSLITQTTHDHTTPIKNNEKNIVDSNSFKKKDYDSKYQVNGNNENEYNFPKTTNILQKYQMKTNYGINWYQFTSSPS